MRIYLDNAATTPICPEVVEIMTQVLKEDFGNPSSIHTEGRKSRSKIEMARKQIASHLNCSIGEIYFTSGGTESNNTALKCSVRDLEVTRIISCETEHHCVLHTLETICDCNEVEVVLLKPDSKGAINLDELETLLKDDSKKTLVSLMYANNEIGCLIDFEQVAALCKSYNCLFHSDTVQAIGHYMIDVEKTPISFLSGAAHKFHGPKGVGFIYINSENIIKPHIDGGSQERKMRGGTENLYGIVGMAKALDLAMDALDERQQKIIAVRNHLISSLKESIDGVAFNSYEDERSLYTVLNVSFPPSDKSDLLLLNLDIAGISASGGSACTSGAEKGSHVLEAIQADPQRKAIRFSFSHHNTKEEIDFLMEKLKVLYPREALINQ